MARVLVIGAGVGGATAAALLAKAGHDVTVLDAHVYAGGCAGTFYHRGYRFDAGATLAGGFQPGGPHDVVGRALGIQWGAHAVDPAWRVHLPDRAITRFGGEARWHAELGAAFHGSRDRDRILGFAQACERVSDAVWRFSGRKPPWPPRNPADLLRTAAALRPDTLIALPHLFETMGQWARRSGVEDRAALAFLDAQLLISAQTTAEHASALFGAAATDLPRKGVCHIDGGIGGIAARLVASIRASGGTVHFRQEVTRLECVDGRIVAAHTNKGARYACDWCIANLTPWDLARLLGDDAPPALRAEIRNKPAQWGAFTLYLGLADETARGSGHDQTDEPDHHQVVMDYNQPLGEGNSVFVSLSRRDDAGRAPQGMRAVTISTHTRAAEWWSLRNAGDRGSAYDARVAQYSERLLRAAERAVPGIRARIRLQLPGTPVTFRTFTRRHRGGVGGSAFTSIFRARSPWTGLRNAWLVGDSIFPGQSTAGVTMGAMRVVADVTRALGGVANPPLPG